MSGLLSRKQADRKGSVDRVSFPKNTSEASKWSHLVRFVRLGKTDKTDSNGETIYNLSYKYCQHMFETIPGMGPYQRKDGSVAERGKFSTAYCQGSPTNPYTQGKADEIPLNEQGVEDCRSIILPNGVPLHDIDQGGTMWEKCLVWSWTNNHMAIIDRKCVFFDMLSEWAQKMEADPFYYDENKPGFDVLLTCPTKGTAYTYSFDTMPPGKNHDIMPVLPLMKAQIKEVTAKINPVKSREDIIQHLGITASPKPTSSAGGVDDDFDSAVGGSSGSVQSAMSDEDSLDMGEDL